MTLIRELIAIPEQVFQGDFVLKLADGVTHAEATLRDYVVTPQLNACFNDALNFIKQSVQGGTSKAAYLHGSFGAGKSHFMAVLNLLLDNNVTARSIPELADVVAQHNGWTQGRKFLLVPYHMIGARSMESAILGGYAEFVRNRHPDAPVPGFYLSERLFEDAVRMRSRIGDAAFFGDLNAGAEAGDGADSGWGELSGGWDAPSFEAAMLEPPSGDDRVRLVGDLIGRYFTAFADVAESRGEAFVPLDDGLSIMSRHAKALGYDAVILFLDELILWLASRAADVSFVSSEGTKLVKLVEAGNADRPIPLVSFVARQRDLRELVGENLAGSLQLQFSDVLRHWEARFHRITLEDRNLAAIAEKRVLRPVSEAARQMLSNAFEEFQTVRPEVLNTLLTGSGDKDIFRKVYPFSPALVQTLIAVSAALQRERTALKLMMQLLVDRRDDLQLGQIIPVGDLFDAISDGDEPFSEGMRIHFDNAKRLYKQKLLPHLERQHGVTWENIRIGNADPAKARMLRNDARLIKTLLLSALVPEVESLKALTAQRLAALNHGTILSPIPGRESRDVLNKCKEWAADIGEIKVTDDTNPLISIQVTGVDIEPIVKGAASNDNPGNRRRRVREMLFEQLGVTDTNDMFSTYPVLWRGTRREVEVLYENVREMSDDKLRGRPGTWTVVIDFPFDDQKYTPADDLARLAAYQGDETQTLVWMPSFFSAKAQQDLGRLVVLDYILTGERFNDFAAHLAPLDRGPAQALLRNQRDQLQQRVRQYLEVAYGIAGDSRDAVVNPLAPEDQFRSLDKTLTPMPPVGANLKSAFEALLDQLFRHQFPAHPVFDLEVKPAAVKKVWPELERAVGASDGRAPVGDRALRQVIRSIADPVQLGKTGETHFVLGDHWRQHFLRAQAKEDALFTVANLRRWMDEPLAMGLPPEAQNLIVLTFAGQTNRSFVRGNVAYTASIDQMPDDLELREQTLPEAGDWDVACRRAASLLGSTIPTSRNAGNVARLVEDVQAKGREVRDAIGSLVRTLNEKSALFPAAGDNQRLQTARSAMALLAGVLSAEGAAVVTAFARARVETSEAAMRQTLAKARELDEAARNANWEIFEAMKAIADGRQAAARAIVAKVGEALAADEHAIGLKNSLADQGSKAVRLLTVAPPQPPAPAPSVHVLPPLAPAAPTPVPSGRVAPKPLVIVQESAQTNLGRPQALALLDELHAKLDQEGDLRLSISWRIEKPGSSQ